MSQFIKCNKFSNFICKLSLKQLLKITPSAQFKIFFYFPQNYCNLYINNFIIFNIILLIISYKTARYYVTIIIAW